MISSTPATGLLSYTDPFDEPGDCRRDGHGMTVETETIKLSGFGRITINETCCGNTLAAIDMTTGGKAREWTAVCPTCEARLTISLSQSGSG